MSDDLSLEVGGVSISGWKDVEISLGIEHCPNVFEIALTEKFPGDVNAVVMKPGDDCIVSIGADVVITGYIDRIMPAILKDRHEIRVTGRGKCQDLVDCSAEWNGNQISSATVLDTAQKLAQPYGIAVRALSDVGAAIPQLNIMLGETGYEIIERISRYRGLLVYESPAGDLILSQAGTEKMASGVAQGENVEEARAVYSMDGRYSSYRGFMQAMDLLGDVGDGGNLLITVEDTQVPRHRQLDIISEQGDSGFEVLRQRVNWELARRVGRAAQIAVTVDAWRDSDGKLWMPNRIVPVDLPILKHPTADWLIADVAFRRDDSGTRAELILMPREAFLPEPFLLFPVLADLQPG